MFVSDIFTDSPKSFNSGLQKKVYETLSELSIPFWRVDTDEAITMEDCDAISKKLGADVVKTLFLCNRQKTKFYLFVTAGSKHFSSKDFSAALDISRVSFAPPEIMEEMVGTKIGAATVFGALWDADGKVRIVIDKAVADEDIYCCSDGTTTGYMKLSTSDVVDKFLTFAKHKPIITEV